MIVLVQPHNQHLLYIDIQREQVVKVKVKVTLEQAMKAQRGSRGSAFLSLTSSLDGVGCQRHVPAALPRERPNTYFVPQDRCGRVRKMSSVD
jgi:hypothetical protein